MVTVVGIIAWTLNGQRQRNFTFLTDRGWSPKFVHKRRPNINALRSRTTPSAVLVTFQRCSTSLASEKLMLLCPNLSCARLITS